MSDSHKVTIREAYSNYVPGFDAAVIVERLLGTVPDKYLRGLDCIVLTNEANLSRRDRVGKVWSRKRKVDKARILGRYYRRTRTCQAYIELRVDKITKWLGRMTVRIWFFREIGFGHVLFHELGHHIHRTIRPEYKEREDVADDWSGKLNANFVRKRYWYALPFLLAATKVYKLVRREP